MRYLEHLNETYRLNFPKVHKYFFLPALVAVVLQRRLTLNLHLRHIQRLNCVLGWQLRQCLSVVDDLAIYDARELLALVVQQILLLRHFPRLFAVSHFIIL